MRKKIIVYSRKRVEDTYSFFYVLYQEKPSFRFASGRKILFSFSWYIFMHKPINLKLEKWIPLRVRVTYYIKVSNFLYFFSLNLIRPRKTVTVYRSIVLAVVLSLMQKYYTYITNVLLP